VVSFAFTDFPFHEGEAPRAYAGGGGDASPDNCRKPTVVSFTDFPFHEGEAPRAYAGGGGDASPDNCRKPTVVSFALTDFPFHEGKFLPALPVEGATGVPTKWVAR
jgi:hypothetical protein